MPVSSTLLLSQRKVFPPSESFTYQPLTSPSTSKSVTKTAISHIIKEIQRYSRGDRVFEPWSRFSLDPVGYDHLLQELRKDPAVWGFFEDKVRYDYFPSYCLFIIRMQSWLHESVIVFITQEILRQLQIIGRSEGSSASFARNIRNTGSPTISSTDTECGPHSPDSAFKHVDAQYPGIIIEVSYSQKRKDLNRLADDYILGSDGNIRVVIGVDIEYRASKRASISVWKPQFTRNDAEEEELYTIQSVVDQIFRSDEGYSIANSTTCLDISLADFAPETVTADFDHIQETISLSYKTLFEFLEKSEAEASIVNRREGKVKASKPVRKRYRENTPPEQLTSEDERVFVLEEQRAAKRTARDD